MPTNEEINERRRQRLGRQVEEMATPTKEPEPGRFGTAPRTKVYQDILIPSRDLAPPANYLPRMWEVIREQLGKKAEDFIAVEVGSRRGHFAAGLMEAFPGAKLFCVDHWGGRMGQGNMHVWLKRVGPWLFDRAFPLRGPSGDWARCFPFQPDLVFIDAEHDYQNVKFDLGAWAPLIQPGGLLIGHDYNQEGVKKAVDEFVAGRDLNLTAGKLGPHHAVTFWVKLDG